MNDELPEHDPPEVGDIITIAVMFIAALYLVLCLGSWAVDALLR